MDGIQKIPGYKNDYPRIEKALNQNKDKRKQEEQDKKKNKKTNTIFDGLASSLEQYTETDDFQYYSWKVFSGLKFAC